MDKYYGFNHRINDVMQNINKNKENNFSYDKAKKIATVDENILDIIPPKFLTYELYLIAINNKNCIFSLESIPIMYRTKKICWNIVQLNGYSLPYLPYKYRTYDFYLMSVKNSGYSISDIPIKYRTYEICINAMNNNARKIKDVPKKYATFKLLINAIRQNHLSFEHMPTKYNKVKNYFKFLCVNFNIWNILPIKFRTHKNFFKLLKNEIFIRTIENNMGQKMTVERVIIDLIKHEPESIFYIPEKMMTKKIAKIIAEHELNDQFIFK